MLVPFWENTTAFVIKTSAARIERRTRGLRNSFMVETKDLPGYRVNREMVDLDPLDDEDTEFLRDTVERHYDETESAVARKLLADWDTAVERFGKVMPKDYKRVLQAQAKAEREGRDVNEAIMEAAHG